MVLKFMVQYHIFNLNIKKYISIIKILKMILLFYIQNNDNYYLHFNNR